MGERSYLAIGDVLALLREEFPDVTISKIRFLESRGLLVPERTPSGYRKFYEPDVDRLRWILRQQREHFLPLKVIKGRLENGMSDPAAPAPPLFEMGDPPPERQPELGREPEPALVGALGAADLAQEGAVAARMPLPPIGVVSPPSNGVPGRGDAPATSDTRGRAETPAKGNGETAPRAVHASRAGTAGSVRAEEPHTHRRPADESPEFEADPTTAAAGPGAPGPGAAGLGAAGLGAAAIAAGASGATAVAAAAGEAEPPRRQRRHSAPPEPATETGPETTTAAGPTTGETGRPATQQEAKSSSSRGSTRSSAGLPGGGTSGTAFSVAEVAGASGLDVAGVEELENFGLIASRVVKGVACYDEEAVMVAKLAARFAPYGIEARHLRIFKHAADRQTGLYAQVITPLLRQRNPEARARAIEGLSELAELGEALMRCFSQATLRELTGG